MIGLGVAIALVLLISAAPAAAVPSPDAVISEVYGGGGNSGATWTQDFVELGNRDTRPVDLTGWSVQYLPANPSATSRWQLTALAGGLQPDGYYLVAQARGTGGIVELPPPDAVGGIVMAAGAGTVALVSSTEPLTCLTAADCAADTRIRDLVGYGQATVRETVPAPSGSNTTSVARTESLSDTDDNARDFTAGSPDPRNSGSDPPPPADEVPPSVEIVAPVEGATYDRGQVVSADYSCTDEAGGSGLDTCVGDVPVGAPIDTGSPGSHTFTVQAVDLAGNRTTERVTYTVADRTPPTVSITTPRDGASYRIFSTVVVDYACTDEAGGSGLASCVGTRRDGERLPTGLFALGRHRFTVTATDTAGNRRTVTHTYRVSLL